MSTALHIVPLPYTPMDPKQEKELDGRLTELVNLLYNGKKRWKEVVFKDNKFTIIVEPIPEPTNTATEKSKPAFTLIRGNKDTR